VPCWPRTTGSLAAVRPLAQIYVAARLHGTVQAQGENTLIGARMIKRPLPGSALIPRSARTTRHGRGGYLPRLIPCCC
jgi:hypothetical protein